jgi:tRNA pseudouridine55 synthase
MNPSVAGPRLLCVDKPGGPTSFDVVRRVRQVSGIRRVGHGGTLDPFATGLLVLGLGAATRLMRFLAEGGKTYVARVRFGFETDTDDRTGRRTRSASRLPTTSDLESALGEFTGRITQVPPRFSAVHVQGERSYRRALRGEDVAPAARQVEVHSMRLIGMHDDLADLEVVCGGGTYIRSLARDLGRRLESAACLEDLRRTRVGRFRVEDAVRFGELDTWWESGGRGIPPAELVADWDRRVLGAALCGRVRNGLQPDPTWWDTDDWDAVPDRSALLDEAGQLVAVATREAGPGLRLACVLPEDG